MKYMKAIEAKISSVSWNASVRPGVLWGLLMAVSLMWRGRVRAGWDVVLECLE